MSRGVNKAIVLGNIGSIDVYDKGETLIVKLSVATNEKWKDKNGDEQQLATWHSVVVFGKLAEIVKQYAKKGDQIYFEGKMRLNTWEDEQGNKRYKTEIIANECQLLSQPSGNGGGAKPPADNYDNQPPVHTKYDKEDFPSDDLPF